VKPWSAGLVQRLQTGWPAVVALAAWLLIVLGPPLALAKEAAGLLAAAPDTGWPALLGLVAPGAARAGLLGRSVALAGGAAVAATVLGFLAATVLWHTRFRRLRWLLLALAPLPPYVHALAWTTAWARWASWTGDAVAPGGGLAQGAWGAALVLVMTALPLATGLALVALTGLPPELVEAARIAQGDAAALRRVVLPLAAPMLLAAAALLFALLLLDYSVPALFQVEVFALALFADYSAHGSAARAALAALPVVAIAATAVVLALASTRRAAVRLDWRPARRGEPSRAPVLRWPVAWRFARVVGMVALVAHLLVPAIFLVVGAASPERVATALTAAAPELRFSLQTAAATALLGLPLAAAAARRLDVGRFGEGLLVLAPLALPAPLVAVGFIVLWNRPGLAGVVYDGGPGPALVSLARFLPLAALVLLAARRRRDPLPVEASLLMGGPWWRRAWRIDLPMAYPGLAAAAALLFALSLGELGATLLVAPPGRATLAMRVFNYLHYGASDAVAGLCLAMAGLTVLCGALAMMLLTRPLGEGGCL
jgi:iron(III) transport system permease protein